MLFNHHIRYCCSHNLFFFLRKTLLRRDYFSCRKLFSWNCWFFLRSPEDFKIAMLLPSWVFRWFPKNYMLMFGCFFIEKLSAHNTSALSFRPLDIPHFLIMLYSNRCLTWEAAAFECRLVFATITLGYSFSSRFKGKISWIVADHMRCWSSPQKQIFSYQVL